MKDSDMSSNRYNISFYYVLNFYCSTFTLARECKHMTLMLELKYFWLTSNIEVSSRQGSVEKTQPPPPLPAFTVLCDVAQYEIMQIMWNQHSHALANCFCFWINDCRDVIKICGQLWLQEQPYAKFWASFPQNFTDSSKPRKFVN